MGTITLSSLEDDNASATSDCDSQNLGGNPNAHQRSLAHKCPFLAPNLDEVAAYEKVQNSAKGRRHSEYRNLRGGSGIDAPSIASIPGAIKWRIVTVEHVAFHDAKHIDDAE